VEAWGLIRETFVDPTFNHQGISHHFTFSFMISFTQKDCINIYYYWHGSIITDTVFCRLGFEVAANHGGNVSPELS